MKTQLELSSNRLTIRQAVEEHIPAILDYYRRNRLFFKPYEPLRPKQFYTDAYWQDVIQIESRDDFEMTQLRFLLFDKSDLKTVIGNATFSGFIRGAFQACYLGYAIDQSQQGQGLMYEALQSMIAYMFDQRNFHRIMANCLPSNERSLKLLEKLGFQKEGLAKEYLRINGKWEDHIMTALTNPNWKESL